MGEEEKGTNKLQMTKTRYQHNHKAATTLLLSHIQYSDDPNHVILRHISIYGLLTTLLSYHIQITTSQPQNHVFKHALHELYVQALQMSHKKSRLNQHRHSSSRSLSVLIFSAALPCMHQKPLIHSMRFSHTLIVCDNSH